MRKQKRKNSDEEGSEMDVDDEEKMDQDRDGDDSDAVDDDDDDDDDDEMPLGESDVDEDEDGDGPPPSTNAPRPVVDNPFMDSFYGLSASDPQERAKAAQCMLQHCLLGPTANSKDAAYSFRRLLNGLCSGRAAARQGNASALASFLKIAFQMGKMEGIRDEANDAGNMSGGGSERDSDVSLLAYVRQRLLAATDPKDTAGRKRASEEKDHQFGRLFGILGVIRSNILMLPSKGGSGHSDVGAIEEVAVSMSADLVELFWLKRWMREPAAHGIVTMLKLFFDQSNDDSKRIAQHIIDSVIVPKILILSEDRNEVEELARKTLLGGYCAEQIGIAAYIQSQPHLENQTFPLDKPIVCKESIPWLGNALSETSSVVQPRTHFVWDALWCYLAETGTKGDKKTIDSSRVSQRRIRETIPLGDEAGIEVLDVLIRLVLEEKLLHMENGAQTAKTTHERRSLALCIVKTLSGVPFVSSISGPTQILLEEDALETVLLTPDVTRTLFLNVICSGSQKQKAAHVLKPLALDVLGSMTKSAIQTEPKRRLAFAKSLLNSDVRFDSRTKTSTVADLLGFSSDGGISEEHVGLWNEFLDHVESRLLQSATVMDDNTSSAETNGFVELLYGTAKIALRLDNKDNGANIEGILAEYKVSIVKRILGLFMAAAFFDCSNVEKPAPKKKKGKRASKGSAPVATSPVLEGATKVNSVVSEGKEIPYAVRSIMAMRFFSLTSEFASVSSREPKDDEKSKIDKDFYTFSILAQLCDDWKQLESSGAKMLVSDSSDGENDEEGDSPLTITESLRSLALKLRKQADGAKENSAEQAKKRCGTGMAVLGMSLYLHRLSCGTNNNAMDEDPNIDLEADEEEISSALEGLKAVSIDFFEATNDESNPLLGLAEICTNILSSPLGSGDVGRGSSPKLLREAVKYAWLGGLRLASSIATEERTLLDASVVEVLLEAVGATDSTNADQEEADSDGSEDEGDDDDSDEGSANDDGEEDSNDGRIFTKASKLLDDPESMLSDKDMADVDSEDESDVEIDPSKLQTMLEEDVDEMDDEDILEHHEGADSALAKLIKMKQEARKSGQQAREKIEVSNQVRCTLLIELLLGRTEGWNRLFRRNAVLAMVLPLLNRRTKVAKMVQKAVDSGSKTGIGEKRALLDRLTVLIKQKLCKLKLSSMPLSSTVDMELAATLVRDIIKEAKQTKDKEIGSCCSSCVTFVLRTMPGSAETVEIATQSYGELVKAWSTKRSSGAFLFDDLIAQMPVLAQAILAGALNRATQEARSTFVKGEAYRLLSLLFATKPSSMPSELEKLSLRKIHDEQDDLLSSVTKSLEDKEMSKPKRARVVLKMLEKMLPFLSAPLSGKAISYLNAIKAQAQKLGADHGEKGLKGTVDKLVYLIDEREVELKSLDDPVAEKAVTDDTSTNPSEDKKAKKKSKKKKKR